MRIPIVEVLVSISVCGLLSAQVDYLYSVSALNGTLRNVSIVYASTTGTKTINDGNGLDARQAYGLARNPNTGTVYSFVTFLGSNVQNFCTLNVDTGVASVVAPVSGDFVGLTSRADGTLFAVKDATPSAPAKLYTIAPATGQATLVMNLPTGTAGEAIVFAPDQSLYRASGRGTPNLEEVLERIPSGTGPVTNVPLTGENHDGLVTLAAYTGSVLIGVDSQSDMYALTTSGNVRRLGTLDHADVTGLLFVPATNNVPFFRGYGDGCVGSSGAQPTLLGCGHASGGHNPGVHLRFAVPGTLGILAAGLDDNSAPFPSATCAAQVMPIFWTMGFVADQSGMFNTWFALPIGTQPTDLYFQVGVLDGTSIRVSNAVRMHVM
jgi:hypothetical protein